MLLMLRFLVFCVVTLSSRVFDHFVSKECQESTTVLHSISTQKISMLLELSWEVQPFHVDLPSSGVLIFQFWLPIF